MEQLNVSQLKKSYKLFMMNKVSNVNPPLRIKILFYSLVIFTGMIIFSIMGTSLQTPFYLSKYLKMNTSYFLPQGWAFFTRDAREEKLLVFKRESNGSLSPLAPPGGNYIYAFGLNREGRKIPMEYKILLKNIDSIAWQNIDYDLSLIAKKSLNTPIIKAINKGYQAKSCGEVIFVKTHTIPWAWSTFKTIKMPSKYVRLIIDCKN